MNNLDYWITMNPDVMGGKPCIRDTRLSVERILQLLACGMSNSEIISDFPELNETKIQSSLSYAASHISKGNVA